LERREETLVRHKDREKGLRPYPSRRIGDGRLQRQRKERMDHFLTEEGKGRLACLRTSRLLLKTFLRGRGRGTRLRNSTYEREENQEVLREKRKKVGRST